jgi:hypothetical protein
MAALQKPTALQQLLMWVCNSLSTKQSTLRQGILGKSGQLQLCTQNLWRLYQPYHLPCSCQLAVVDLAEGLSTPHLLPAWLTQCLQAVSSAAADKLHWCMTFTLDHECISIEQCSTNEICFQPTSNDCKMPCVNHCNK